MSPPSLNEIEIQSIKQALITRRSEKGDRLLGAQLGQEISKAIAPRQIRDLPLLRDLAKTELGTIVEVVPDASTSADLQYLIVADQAPAPILWEELQPVVGPELWRFFSNPNQSCSLAIEPSSGTIYVAGLRAMFPVGLKKLERMGSDDYRVLAGQYAEQQDSPVREKLSGCLGEKNFYDSWINALRVSGSPERRLLKTWEILRTEHIAKRLGERLTSAGVAEALQAEIISAARARKKPASQQAPAQERALTPTPQRPSQQITVALSEDAALERLREIVHAAVDGMSITELREVRIPVGILFDVTQQKRS